MLFSEQINQAGFAPTHRHVKSGGLYRVTDRGRLEVTGDDAYPLVVYRDAAGEKFAQRPDRFDDGRLAALEGTGK